MDRAGEIGHTTVDPFSGLRCKCGNTGCLELFASATAIVRMTRESLASFPSSRLKSEGLTAEEVYEAGAMVMSLRSRCSNVLGCISGLGWRILLI
jgi:glucokinase